MAAEMQKVAAAEAQKLGPNAAAMSDAVTQWINAMHRKKPPRCLALPVSSSTRKLFASSHRISGRSTRRGHFAGQPESRSDERPEC